MPILESFRLETKVNGQRLVVFERKQVPRQDANTYQRAGRELASGLRDRIERIVEAVGGERIGRGGRSACSDWEPVQWIAGYAC